VFQVLDENVTGFDGGGHDVNFNEQYSSEGELN
jgi:hypothetical protein